MNLGDIYYVLFRHKWKILVCSLLGFGACFAVFKLRPPPLQSQAKILVRYIVSEPRTVPAGIDAPAKSPDQRGETIMASEIEILTSFDLAKQVAEAIGPAKILGNNPRGPDLNLAANVINRGLVVTAAPRSSIIQLTFSHADPEIVQAVLNEVVQRYFKMHGDIHRTKGMLGDFLIQETDQYRSRLQQTEEELRKARSRAGVFAIDDGKKLQTEQMAALRQQIFAVEADLVQRSALLQQLAKRAPDSPEPAPAETEAPLSNEVVEEYKVASARLTNLQRTEQELLMQYTAENGRVRDLRARLAEAEAAKRKLEEVHPALLRTAPEKLPSPSARPSPVDQAIAVAEIAALQAKLKQLNTQFETLREEAGKIDAVEGEVAQLRRKKELDESNYRLFAISLEQSRISDALSNGRVSNLTLIQTPTPPAADMKKLQKLLAGIGFGGIAVGLGWAFLIEFYLDRSVRRPIDVERGLKLPLFLAIPVVPRRLLLRNGNSGSNGTNGNGALAASPLQPFYETLRDRLIVSFENRGLTHKPKLVAVTGLETGSGVSTIASGLAGSLSETGGGNVLFVDMTIGQGSSQQFVKGKPVCGFDALLDNAENAKVEPCLYVVAENSNMPQLSRNLPQRFMRLAPRLKASDFDYIIFDMPPVSQISITPRIAGFMDIVLLVAQAEHTDRESTQRAADLLAQSKAPVGVVLNKTRTYVPSLLHREFLTTV